RPRRQLRGTDGAVHGGGHAPRRHHVRAGRAPVLRRRARPPAVTWTAAMRRALAEAAAAGARGEVPVGAVVLGPAGEELAAAGNAREATADPTAHAEVLALRAAARG